MLGAGDGGSDCSGLPIKQDKGKKRIQECQGCSSQDQKILQHDINISALVETTVAWENTRSTNS